MQNTNMGSIINSSKSSYYLNQKHYDAGINVRISSNKRHTVSRNTSLCVMTSDSSKSHKG